MAANNNDGLLRHKSMRNTKFDVKNDPSWHYQENTFFEILQIVKTGVTDTPVETFQDLNVVDKGKGYSFDFQAIVSLVV